MKKKTNFEGKRIGCWLRLCERVERETEEQGEGGIKERTGNL